MVELTLRVVVSLGVVLGLFWTVARLGSRKLGGRERGLVRVRTRQSLSRTASLAVVEVGARVLVVGVSDAGVRLLTELDPDELLTEELVAEESVAEESGPRTLVLGPQPEADQPAAVARVGYNGTHVRAGSAQGGALGGSLLSATTWRQALDAARGRQAEPSRDEAAC